MGGRGGKSKGGKGRPKKQAAVKEPKRNDMSLLEAAKEMYNKYKEVER